MDIGRLKININGKPSPGFKGADSAFHEIASLVGGQLPESYIRFIRQVDGGHPEIGSFRGPGDDPNNMFEVDWFYSVGNPAVKTVKDAIASWGAVLGAGTLPIGRDGGGNQIYISLDSSSVWLYLHDEGGKRLRVADNFEHFVDSLVMNPDFI